MGLNLRTSRAEKGRRVVIFLFCFIFFLVMLWCFGGCGED